MNCWAAGTAKQGDELRELISAARGEGGKVLPEKLKHRVVRFSERRRHQGTSLKTTAKELGLSGHTLSYWRAKVWGRKRKLRQVQVVAESTTGITVTGPCGIRLEGLSIEQAAELLRRLG